MSLNVKSRTSMWLLFILLLLMALAVASCSSASDQMTGNFEGEAFGEIEGIDEAGDFEESGADEAGDEAAPDNEAPGQPDSVKKSPSKPRFIVRTGSVELTVQDARKTARQIGKLIDNEKGMVSDSKIYQLQNGQYAAELSLRVPENRFDSLMAQLEKQGKAANVHKSSEDVTLAYRDLESRIENLKVSEKRLRQILGQAASVEEILLVEEELSRVRGQIEAMTTEFIYLQDQVSFSTVTVQIDEEVVERETVSEKPFADIGGRIKEAFFGSINYILMAAAFLLVLLAMLLPVLLVGTLIVLAIIWLVRAIRRRKSSAASGGQPPAVS